MMEMLFRQLNMESFGHKISFSHNSSFSKNGSLVSSHARFFLSNLTYFREENYRFLFKVFNQSGSSTRAFPLIRAANGSRKIYFSDEEENEQSMKARLINLRDDDNKRLCQPIGTKLN